MECLWLRIFLLGSFRALFVVNAFQGRELHGQVTPPKSGLEPSAAMSKPTSAAQQAELARSTQAYTAQRQLATSEVFAAQQRLWMEERRKRGPPSTTISSLNTPAEDDEMQQDAEPSRQATPQPATSLFQPIPVEGQAAFSMTAAQAGVDINDHTAVRNYMSEKVTTRQQVLETIRNYHVGVIRPEVYHLISQVELVIAGLDDRLVKTQDNLNWMVSDNRAQQKREAGLMVVLTGFDPKMDPTQRLEHINWMMGQVEEIKQFLVQRMYNASDQVRLWFLQALQTDPSTPPAGEGKWSTVTTLQFKAWDLRRAFMTAYGGGGGTPLWGPQGPVKGFHIRCTPSSPQFQRKLELPVRAILFMLNKHAEMKSTPPSPMLILWRTLTLMHPDCGREFDERATAWARMIYFTQNGEFRGRLEITADLADIVKAKPPEDAEEATLWDFSWNSVAFGIQAELDKAEKAIMQEAQAKAKGSSKGWSIGKGKTHWSNCFIYSSEYNPFPIPMSLEVVESVSYSWDEYCDKTNTTDKKCGSYSTGTICGAPPTATPPAGEQTELSKAAPKGARESGRR